MADRPENVSPQVWAGMTPATQTAVAERWAAESASSGGGDDMLLRYMSQAAPAQTPVPPPAPAPPPDMGPIDRDWRYDLKPPLPQPVPLSNQAPQQAPVPVGGYNYNPNPNNYPPRSGAALGANSGSSSDPLFNNPFSKMGGSVAKIQEDADGNPVPYDKAKEDAAKSGIGIPQFPSQSTLGSAASAPTVIPAHNQPLVDPRLQDELKDAYRAQQRTIDDRVLATYDVGISQALKGDFVAQGLEGEGKKLGEMEAETKRAADEREKSLADFRKKIDDYSAEAAKAKIDPRRAWNDMSVGGKLAQLGAAMAFGFLQGTGKVARNTALDRIDAMMAADVHAQMSEYEAKKGRIADMNSLYAQAYKATGDKADAYKLAMGYGYEQVKKETERLAAMSDSPIFRAKAQEAVSELAERQAQIGIAAKKDEIAMNKWVAAGLSGGGAGKGGKDDALIFRGADGKFYHGRNKESRDKLADVTATTMGLAAATEEYADALKKLSTADLLGLKAGVIPSKDAQRAVTSYGTVQDLARKSANFGTPQKAELELMAARIPPPDQLTGDPTIALATLRKASQNTLSATMTAESPIPVDEEIQAGGPVRNFTGNHYVPPPSAKNTKWKPAGAK